MLQNEHESLLIELHIVLYTDLHFSLSRADSFDSRCLFKFQKNTSQFSLTGMNKQLNL